MRKHVLYTSRACLNLDYGLQTNSPAVWTADTAVTATAVRRAQSVKSYPLHALVLVVWRLLDAVDVVLEGGVTPGVVLLLNGEEEIKPTGIHADKEDTRHTEEPKDAVITRTRTSNNKHPRSSGSGTLV